MNKRILLFGLIALLFVACKSKEEKANELIKAELYKTLYDFSSYEPIETIIDSAFTSIYSDSTILRYAYRMQACLNLSKEHMEEIKDARSTMDIWGDSYSAYSRRKYNEAKEKYETNLDKATYYLNMINEIMPSIKQEINNFEPSFCGYQAKHKFRCKTKGGNSTFGNYLYIIDEKFEKILSVTDLDDDDEVKIKNLIDEAKDYVLEDE